ncbi:hypothetical protein [Bombilactobacillus bombi]|nr:hypothetical protein [Bombilactobacillus bombi]
MIMLKNYELGNYTEASNDYQYFKKKWPHISVYSLEYQQAQQDF